MGKIVPVLLETEDFELLEHLMSDPKCVNEKFLFQNQLNSHYRGHDLLGKLSMEVTLEKPLAIRYVSFTLRYINTAQIYSRYSHIRMDFNTAIYNKI
jgi:hypothetical protein